MFHTKVELIESIKREYALFDAALAKIPAERLSEAGAVGEWSVKDVVAHLAVWCSRAVTLLFQAERNGKPQLVESKVGDWSDVSAKDYASQKDRPLDRILDDFHGSHLQLVKRLDAWKNDADLFDTKCYPTLKNKSLSNHVWEHVGAHFAEHRAEIENWLTKRM